MADASSPFPNFPFPRKVDQDAAHQLSGNREKMRAILPIDLGAIDQPDVDLIDKCCCLQKMPGSFARHISPRGPMQLAVDERGQLGQRLFVACLPGFEQSGNSVIRGMSHAVSTMR